MKKSHFALLLTIPLLLASCSNAGNTKLSYSDVDTIKEIIKDRESQVSWTRALEGSRLDEDISADKEIYDKNIKLNHTIAKLNRAKQNSVFPEFPDFGSLDTRLLSFQTKEAVQKFCKSLSSDFYNQQTSFDSSYIFNLVFFRNDFIEGWNKNFSEDFPAKKTKDETEEKKEELFTYWLLGEPFIGEEITQVPVRFYCKQGIVDVTLYLNRNNLINQILIDRWEKL